MGVDSYRKIKNIMNDVIYVIDHSLNRTAALSCSSTAFLVVGESWMYLSNRCLI